MLNIQVLKNIALNRYYINKLFQSFDINFIINSYIKTSNINYNDNYQDSYDNNIYQDSFDIRIIYETDFYNCDYSSDSDIEFSIVNY